MRVRGETASAEGVTILGGGLAGLSAGHILTKAGVRVRLFEKDPAVGGLSRTVVKEGFRFDLGGHRFFTLDERVERFVRDLMEGELIAVTRTSKIYMQNKFFDYPLKPLNAIFGLGIFTTLRILGDYGSEKVAGLARKAEPVSLEDWVVTNFGRTMFNIYFRDYSEKVWGIECKNISAEWVAQRIKGLSLAKAVKNAFFKFSGKDIPTLADRFMYPQLGIGRLSDRLRGEIEAKNSEVFTDTRVVRISHSGDKIVSITVKGDGREEETGGREFISSLPLPSVVRMLHPPPPDEVIEAASRLRFRDLVVVAVMVDRERVTDQTWIYIQERGIPFGRIHEPTNWSRMMAPEGKTLVVMEFFSFKGDDIWNMADERLVDLTVGHLEKLGFIGRHEVLDSSVVRVPRAYPLFDVGYRRHCDRISDYLGRFENLHVAGRGGMFRYYNMDHAIQSGICAAERLTGRAGGQIVESSPEMALSGP